MWFLDTLALCRAGSRRSFPPSSGLKLEVRKPGARDSAANPPARVAVLHVAVLGRVSFPLKWREGSNSTAGCFGWVFPPTLESEEAECFSQ